jgi:hypothetical protein
MSREKTQPSFTTIVTVLSKAEAGRLERFVSYTPGRGIYATAAGCEVLVETDDSDLWDNFMAFVETKGWAVR